MRCAKLQKQWANGVKSLFGGRCWYRMPVCEALGITAHHVFPVAEYPEIEHKIWNGIVLCEMCHHTVHGDECLLMELQEMLKSEGCFDDDGAAWIHKCDAYRQALLVSAIRRTPRPKPPHPFIGWEARR